jgi:ATP adenylyltransferase
MAYVRELGRRAESSDLPASPDFFADYWAHPEHDDRNLVIHRDAHGMVLLNRYPYANGHLLVALGEACPCLLDYSAEQRAAFWRLVDWGMDLMQRSLEPQGINMGINQGDAAGAGVPCHLHAHIIPRWNADTNFITVVGGVRVIPDALETMAEQYRATLRNGVAGG